MFLTRASLRAERPSGSTAGEEVGPQRHEEQKAGRIVWAIRSWISARRQVGIWQYAPGALAAAISALGIAIRLYLYAINRSFWGDEAKVALNLIHRSFTGLFLPLDYAEVAPVGFLLLEKAVITAFGNTDYVLRIVPLLSGVVAVPLMYLLARRFSGGLGAMLSLSLFAVNASLIYYSTELKQFSSDVLATIVLLLAGSQFTHDRRHGHAVATLAVAGILTTWISHPSVFVLGGVLLTLGVSLFRRRDWRRLRQLLALGALFAANLALQYFSSLRQMAQNRLLTNYWQWSFAPLPVPGGLSWYLDTFKAILQDPVGLSFGLVTAGLFIAGLLSLAFRRLELLLFVTAPVLFALLASGLKLYPFTGRFLLFAVPLLLIPLAEGLERIRSLLLKVQPAGATLVAAASCVFLLYQPLGAVRTMVASPPLRDHIKPAMAYVSEHHLSSDVIYVYYYGTVQFEYYAPFYGLAQAAYVPGEDSRDDPTRYLKDIDSLVGNQRVWFIFSHNYRSGKIDEQRYFLNHLDEIGVKQAEFYAPGVAVYLYDLSRRP